MLVTGLASWILLAAPAASLQQPNATAAAIDLEHALKTHPFFSKLAFDRDDGHPPFLFLFQRIPGSSPQRAADIVQKMAPALDSARQVFEQQIARPNALALRPGYERFPVIVLGSKAELENCQRATRSPWHLGGWMLHDTTLNA